MHQAVRNHRPGGARSALESLRRKLVLIGTLATELAALSSMLTALAIGLVILKSWLGPA